VFRRFDHADLHIPDGRALGVLLEVWRLAHASSASAPAFPFAALLFPEQPYRHARAHLTLLRAAVLTSADAGVDFLAFAPRALRAIAAAPFDGTAELSLAAGGSSSSSSSSASASSSNHCWCSVELVETVLNLAETHAADLFIPARALLRLALDQAPGMCFPFRSLWLFCVPLSGLLSSTVCSGLSLVSHILHVRLFCLPPPKAKRFKLAYCLLAVSSF
jgi:hypothetical protein